jgi:membrane protein
MLRSVFDSVPLRVLKKFNEDQAPKWAVVIAWNALTALLPILVGIASIIGFALSFTGVTSSQIHADIVAIIPEAARADAEAALSGAKQASGLLLLVALLGLLWTGAGLFGTMEQAFAVIYHTRPRSFIRGKLMGFGMMLLFTALAGLAVGSSLILPALKSLPFVPRSLSTGLLAVALQLVTGTLSSFILFAAIYYVVPNRRQRRDRVWPGALVAAVLFEVVTLTFPLYLEFNKGLQAYGKTFGLFLVLLTFFYFFGLIVMIGVETNSVIHPVPPVPPEQQARAGALQRGRRPAAVDKDAFGQARDGSGPDGGRSRAPSPPAPAGIGLLRSRWVRLYTALGALTISWAAGRATAGKRR